MWPAGRHEVVCATIVAVVSRYSLLPLKRGTLMATANVPTFSFLVCGRTGIGKSTLVNFLVGKELCKVNDPGLLGGSFDPCTTEITLVSKKINGIVVNVWDYPGLEGARDETEYIDKMEKACGKRMENIDLILYCTDMTIVRVPTEVIEIKALTGRFGQVFWEKSVFVMTKGNAVGFGTPKGRSREYHKNVYYNLKRELCSKLIDLKVSKHIAESVPAVAAGYIEEEDESDMKDPNRYLLYVSDQIKETDPPTRHDFLPEMWVTCFCRIANERARDYFWKFSGRDRIVSLAKDDQSPAQKYWQEAIEANSEKVIEALEKSFTGAVTFFKRKFKKESEVLKNISGARELHLDDDQRKRMDAGLEEIERTM